MDNKIIYRIAAEADYPAIMILYNRMYQVNRSLNDFKWLTENNPAGRATLFIAIMDDKVVGMQSLIPYWFVRNGVKIFTFKSEDTLVEKDLRGRGIFSKMYEMLHTHARETLVWGLTDKKKILERVNMTSSERLTIAISVKKPTLIHDNKGLHRFVAKTLLYTYLYFKSSFKSNKTIAKLDQKELAPSDYGSIEIKEFFDRMSMQNSNTLFPIMDSEYLKWRLTENPNLDSYKVVVSLNKDGSIAICSIIGFEGKAAYWQSFYALNEVTDEEKIGHINYHRKQIFNSGINLIHSWLFECNDNVKKVKELFYKSGFSKVRDGLWIVHNSTNKEINVHDMYFSPQLGIR